MAKRKNIFYAASFNTNSIFVSHLNKKTMKKRNFNLNLTIILLSFIIISISLKSQAQLQIDEHEQFTTHGFSVMAFHNDYYEGRRGAIELVLHGTRIASNGDIRLEPVPIPDAYDVLMPKFKKRKAKKKDNQISVDMEYPDLGFDYRLTLTGNKNELRIAVDIKGEIADSLYGKLAFMLELFPGSYKGKSYYMDDTPGIFPTQFNGKRQFIDNELEAVAIVSGKKLSIAPEDDLYHFSIESKLGKIELVDGRASTNHKWYIVRSILPKQKSKRVVEWVIKPHINTNWLPEPVVGFSQIGYNTEQTKISVIEIHEKDKPQTVYLKKVSPQGKISTVKEVKPKVWGKYYRRKYLHFDFTNIKNVGMYFIEYKNQRTEIFPISKYLFAQEFWRTTLETFIPVQMCHVAVKDRLRLWHGACHLDDARQAPAGIEHFDHYHMDDEIQTGFEAYEHIPHMNKGGWHDAGDVDIESSSNSSTLHTLSLAYENFHLKSDQTSVNYDKNQVRLYQPDGKPDILQQIVHGAEYVLGSYRAYGFYSRGVVCPHWYQYLQMGDAASQTDGFVFNPELSEHEVKDMKSGKNDDRLVFSNKSSFKEYSAGIALAAASRALADFNPKLSDECLTTALQIWENEQKSPSRKHKHPYYKYYQTMLKKQFAIELFISTKQEKYKKEIIADFEKMKRGALHILWSISRVADQIDDKKFRKTYKKLLAEHKQHSEEMFAKSPYSMPQIHTMFGTGFRFMGLANDHFFLYKNHPDIFNKDFIYNVIAYIHGNHPASNHSLVNGVGAKSITSAYGINRADFSYVPGGICAGPLIIQPDLIEFRTEDPFFWVQKEYTIASGASYVFLMLAAEDIEKK